MTKKVAVILSGCGVYDGAEIHESTLSLLALDQAGAAYQCFAPDVPQLHVINHLNGEEMDESRNVLIESARIARGAIKPLADFDAADFDAVLLPGGFGAAKNLSDFAVKGADAQLNTALSDALKAMRAEGKPIGALCIAPVILAQLFEGASVTVGAACDASEAIESAFGGKHTVTTHAEIVVDDALNLVTSPCYMLDASISQIYAGATAVVAELLKRVS